MRRLLALARFKLGSRALRLAIWALKPEVTTLEWDR